MMLFVFLGGLALKVKVELPPETSAFSRGISTTAVAGCLVFALVSVVLLAIAMLLDDLQRAARAPVMRLARKNRHGIQKPVKFPLYSGDGRFHLEAIMIANPSLPYYRYDPYSKVISAEGYAHDQLHHNRKKAIDVCSSALTSATVFGVIQVLFLCPLSSTYPP